MRFVTLKIFPFGSSNSKPLVDKLVVVDDASDIHFRCVIRDAVNENNGGELQFEIQKIVGTGGTDLNTLLGYPLKCLPVKFDVIHVTIIPNGAASEEDSKEQDVVDIMEENKVEMTFLEPQHSLEEVTLFQESYANMTVGRQKFLANYPNKPTYDSQIKTAVLNVMENPLHGMMPAGFRERKGDRYRRMKETADADVAASDLSAKKPSAGPRKIDQSGEKEALESAGRCECAYDPVGLLTNNLLARLASSSSIYGRGPFLC